ncbi:DUF2829 domain-containing protein [Enterobacteriaceae bacterium 4M9]|nr:DUF2829 domain-containing protein [Enterobacteriaceae bacterium 4M9]
MSSIAVTGSFEWAMLNLKQGKRVARAGWNGKNMFLLGNPGLPEQAVAEGDFRNNAGVETGTEFNYLPNIEICTVDGDFVPWVASQMDIEAMDWALLCDEDENSMLVLDIHAQDKAAAGANYSGYRRSLIDDEDVRGTCEIIENQVNATEVFMFTSVKLPESEGGRHLIQFGSSFEEDAFEETKELMNQVLTIKVDGEIYSLGSAVGLDDYFDTLIWREYDISEHSVLVEKLNDKEGTHRYYFNWGE